MIVTIIMEATISTTKFIAAAPVLFCFLTPVTGMCLLQIFLDTYVCR